VTCPSVVTEYRNVCSYPKFAGRGFPPQWLERLIQKSQQLPEPDRWSHPLPDPTDAPFLALAHAANAWLITGNLKHFPESARDGVTAVSPAEYLDHLTAR
jgi:predicted nucleic acid-binding protein